MKTIAHKLLAALVAVSAAFSGTAWAETALLLKTGENSSGPEGNFTVENGFSGVWDSSFNSYPAGGDYYDNSLWISPFIKDGAESYSRVGYPVDPPYDGPPWGPKPDSYWTDEYNYSGPDRRVWMDIATANDRSLMRGYYSIDDERWFYDATDGGSYEHRFVDSDGNNVVDNSPFDPGVVQQTIVSSYFPILSYSIFDFQNSWINYEDGSSVALSEVLTLNARPRAGLYTNFSGGGIRFLWNTVSPISSISLAYNLPSVPEPETCAMLLAGLGLVGVAARRQRKPGCR